MRARLELPVLCQGEDSLGGLLRAFAGDPRTCLFGTLSLWQGVDVPGSACQLVVIDRIPFPRPDDPLSAARQQAVDAAGGNGFMTVSAAHAALLLAQGSGRLIPQPRIAAWWPCSIRGWPRPGTPASSGHPCPTSGTPPTPPSSAGRSRRSTPPPRRRVPPAEPPPERV